MSLFDVLVARAQGEAAIAQPRRRSRFEQVDTDPDAIGETVGDRGETPAPVPRFPQPRKAVVLSDADRPQPISPMDPLLATSPTPAQRSVDDPLVPPLLATSPTRPRQVVNDPLVRALSATDHRVPSDNPTLPRTRNERGPPPALNQRSAENLDPRGDRTELSPAPSPDTDRSFPLATEMLTPAVAGHDSGPDAQASVHHDSQPTPLVEVHIGTIEVVTKAPPAPLAVPQPRPPAARISLDDYRRQAR